MAFSDRRSFSRYQLYTRATLRVGATEHIGTMMNLSMSGALFIVDTTLDLPIGQGCMLMAYSGEGERKYISLESRIVDLHNHLVGIKFAEASDDEKKALQRMVDFYLEAPRPLYRETPAMFG